MSDETESRLFTSPEEFETWVGFVVALIPTAGLYDRIDGDPPCAAVVSDRVLGVHLLADKLLEGCRDRMKLMDAERARLTKLYNPEDGPE